MSAPNRGFAVMRRPMALAKAYDSSPVGLANRPFVNQLLALLPHVRPELYRGIGRYPLNADYDYVDPGWQWANRVRPIGEEQARRRLAQILDIEGTNVREEDWLIDGPWLVPDPDRAKELMDLLGNRDAYEVIEVACYPSRTDAASLGFDVGYWASGNFSLICDTAVWPLWHPPSLQALEDLRLHLVHLNDNVLFPNLESALLFREWYRAQPWAEKEDEPDEFEVVEVAREEKTLSGTISKRKLIDENGS